MRLGNDRVGGNVRELKPKRRLTVFKWIGRAAVLLVLSLSVGRYVWGLYGDRVWERDMARYRDAATRITVAAVPKALPPEEDAAVDLVAAGKQLYDDPRGNWVLNDSESLVPLDEEQLTLTAGLLRRLDGVWTKLDAAERKPAANWHVEGDFDRSLWQVTRITPFLQVAARYYHQTGDDRRALLCVRHLLCLGEIVGRPRDGYFKAIGTFQTAARTILQVAPGLRIGTEAGAIPEEDVRALIASMLDESGARPALIRQFEYQRSLLIDDSEACANGRFPKTTRLTTILHEPWARWVLKPMIQSDTSLMLRQADQVIVAAGVADDVPTLLSIAPEAGGLRVLREENPYLHLWAVTCWPRYEEHVRQHFQTVAERRMAATALALRAYSIMHGDEFPARLDALIPEWLPAVPGDPMAHERSLTYRAGGADPLLYSVGRDGIDDGGSGESPRKEWTPAEGSWSHLWWKRDAVVHLRGAPVDGGVP
jgi:hypothetical protein